MDDLGDLTLWRVGYHSDPVGFAPRRHYGYSHRFDDVLERGWRTIYCAMRAETALREVLADLRPNTATIARFVKKYGPKARDELPSSAIPEEWRRNNVLVPVRIVRDGDWRVLDLTDQVTRLEVETRHAELLADHGMAHLDLNEITTSRRVVTRQIATTAYDEESVAVVRYPSRLDGSPCFALFEERAFLEQAADAVVLTDPPPEALENVAAGWNLTMQAAPPAVPVPVRSARQRSAAR